MTIPTDKKKPIVVLGLLGMQLDAGSGPGRWSRWRPTVSLFDRDDLPLVRLELLAPSSWRELAARVGEDVRAVAPQVQVVHHTVDFNDPWDFQEVFGTLHDFAASYPFRPDEERYWVHITTGTHVAQICLFLLAESRIAPAELVQTAPSRDRPHPLSVIDLDLARYDPIARRFADRAREAQGILKAGIDTRNPAFNRTIAQIEQVAAHSTAPILLLGPTGSGKTRLARQIYALRRSRHLVTGPWVEVNCATLRGDAAMSALFGHVRGAFTGAAEERPGLLRQADRGVLFLDEISELGLDEQAMLLHAIEDGRFRPLGADREVSSEFQLIAGTNRPLAERASAGAFRDDLLARINLWTFHLPGLAERREDVEPNLDYELDALERRTARRVRFNREARERYLRFATSDEARWSGNFRDLHASIERMGTLAAAGRIDAALVDDEIARLRAAWRGATPPDAASEILGDLVHELDRFDRVQLADVLQVCRASRSLSEAGRALFAASRARKTSTNDADRLRKYLGRFGLTWEDTRLAGG
ncbi:MAG TPA: RNA repair transcriptional activator RtcR [Myxococcota bacterium]|nr:RNA repair transcriptional activator RtcR [Myxococcota bacterium]